MTASATDMLIIGAGIAGLAAGCYAQMNGYRTKIFELHNQPGGLCTGSGPGQPFYQLWQELGAIQVGGYQEWRAEQSSRALQQLLKIRAAVMRDREVREIDANDMVPGDVVWLESRNRIPADIRLIRTHNLEVDESLW